MNKKLSIISLCSTGLAATQSQGSVVFNDFADITLSLGGINTAFYDFETASISLTETVGVHDYSISTIAGENEGYIIDSLQSGYLVFGGEFFGTSYAGGAGDTFGSQKLATAYKQGDVLDGSDSFLGDPFLVITELTAEGAEYDFSKANTAIGFIKQSGGEEYYGFLNADRGSLILKSGGTENSADTAITVVPEPSSLALLSLGVLGIATHRRRQAS
ncbi:MAG: PEP-CTERM sorting domain-containing protein [Akkermansiaceae bacterium]